MSQYTVPTTNKFVHQFTKSQGGPPLPMKHQGKKQAAFNQPISNKSNIQHQQDLKYKSEITIKINRLSELSIYDTPRVHQVTRDAAIMDFQVTKDNTWVNTNLPLIGSSKKNNRPIRTRQLIGSTYKQTKEMMHTSRNGRIVSYTIAPTAIMGRDPVDEMIAQNHLKYDELRFDGQVVRLIEDSSSGVYVEMRDAMSEFPTSAKKRPLQVIDTNVAPSQQNNFKKRHKYDMPLENSRTISAKEVLRMVDSSLVSSDMDLSQNNSTSTSILVSDTPLKANPSYLKLFGAGNTVLSETPLKNSVLLQSTPQSGNRFMNNDEDYRASPINVPKLRNV